MDGLPLLHKILGAESAPIIPEDGLLAEMYDWKIKLLVKFVECLFYWLVNNLCKIIKYQRWFLAKYFSVKKLYK